MAAGLEEAGWGLRGERVDCSVPVEAHCSSGGRSECGSRSYVGNASLSFARVGPEEPTTLFKEMAVRGPSTILSLFPFL